jgi:seryl-tRNA synthetase
MPRKKIGSQVVSVRLYFSDEKHIKEKVKTEGQTDTRFSNPTNATRYYVSLGVAAERQVANANSLGDRIIKASQKEVVLESLNPLKNAIDSLASAVEELQKSQQVVLGESHRLTHTLAGEVRNLAEVGNRELQNIFIIRSILFVFLLGIKTNRIQPDERTPWDKLITFAHQRAQELAAQEVEAGEGSDSEFVRQLANDLFTAIRQFQSNP